VNRRSSVGRAVDARVSMISGAEIQSAPVPDRKVEIGELFAPRNGEGK
jgi:hypothetical protein